MHLYRIVGCHGLVHCRWIYPLLNMCAICLSPLWLWVRYLCHIEVYFIKPIIIKFNLIKISSCNMLCNPPLTSDNPNRVHTITDFNTYIMKSTDQRTFLWLWLQTLYQYWFHNINSHGKNIHVHVVSIWEKRKIGFHNSIQKCKQISSFFHEWFSL